MKRIAFLLSTLILVISCTEKGDNYPIPVDENGNIILTQVSTTTTTGISTLDESFTVTAWLPNAKSGDQMTVECLQLQPPPNGGSNQLLPLSGTQKTVTVGSDLKAEVTYTRTEANLKNLGDYVTVTFAGETDYALQRVDVVNASATSKPKVIIGTSTVDGKTVSSLSSDIEVARTSETAYFVVTVTPKSGRFEGQLVAQTRYKGEGDDKWTAVKGSPFTAMQWVQEGSGTPYEAFLIPISGDDFKADDDNREYKFSVVKGNYEDLITTSVTVLDPYFFLKRSAAIGISKGVNIKNNSIVAIDDANAAIAVDETLTFTGGTAWLTAGNKIEFVPTTNELYAKNNSNETIAAFEAGTKTTTAKPLEGTGVYIFKAVTGTAASDTYYGMLKVVSAIPSTSVTIEYRIGNMYAHLSVLN
ncbi:MAG: hypothetical protein LBR50_05480 [Tannerella sp.]|jgi:hypothetical protein|nr:hypothetical protein [Tannerella sp.]